ncbi:hypothetical protein K439DRAFT_1547657 [Ramaria rubella]|nr:hypothetical protein K439DRAFT_1547657 [Ramaria rubella]
MDVNQVLQGRFTNAELDLQLDWHRQFCEDLPRKKDVLTKALNSQALQQVITNLLACQQTQTDPRISMKDAAAEPQRCVRSHMRPAKGLVIPPDCYLLSTPQLFDRICMTLGGHVSEEIFFETDQIMTGARDDLQKITCMVFKAVANYGMNAIVGPVRYGGGEGQRKGFQKPFSEKTGEMLDNEVWKMIKKQPFAGCSDEMDKWLDTNPTFGERRAPLPSIEGSPFLW